MDHRNQRGLTLLELLIAGSIFVVVMATVYAGFSSGVFGVRDIEKKIVFSTGASRIMGSINKDLRNAFIFKENQGGLSGDESGMEFFSLTDLYSGEENNFAFSRVAYTQDGEKLFRLCKTGKEALKDDSVILPEEISRRTRIEFEYGYIPAGEEEIRFKDSWGRLQPGAPENDESGPYPLAVKVTLTFEGKESFERTIYLFPYS